MANFEQNNVVDRQAGPNPNRLTDLAIEIAQNQNMRQTAEAFLTTYCSQVSSQPIVRAVIINGNSEEKIFSEQLLNGYSDQGVLIHISRTKNMTEDERYNFFVATADLITGEIHEWRVNQLSHYQDQYYCLQSKLVITNEKFDTHHGGPLSMLNNADLDDMAMSARSRREDRQRQESQPYILMSSQGFWFKPAGGHPQTLGPIGRLVRDLQSIDADFACQLNLTATDSLPNSA